MNILRTLAGLTGRSVSLWSRLLAILGSDENDLLYGSLTPGRLGLELLGAVDQQPAQATGQVHSGQEVKEWSPVGGRDNLPFDGRLPGEPVK